MGPRSPLTPGLHRVGFQLKPCARWGRGCTREAPCRGQTRGPMHTNTLQTDTHARVCVCVCVCLFARAHIHTHTYAMSLSHLPPHTHTDAQCYPLSHTQACTCPTRPPSVPWYGLVITRCSHVELPLVKAPRGGGLPQPRCRLARRGSDVATPEGVCGCGLQ